MYECQNFINKEFEAQSNKQAGLKWLDKPMAEPNSDYVFFWHPSNCFC